MKKGDKYLLGLLLMALLVGSYFYLRPSGDILIAELSIDGELIRQIDLSEISEPYEFTIEPHTGEYNTVRVEKGRIQVVAANCPAQIDVKQGWIDRPGQSIVCLPHTFVIYIRGSEDADLDGIVY